MDVDHGFELRNVQSARGDVGGHQYRAAAVGKLRQHLVALALLQFAMQGQRAKALGLQKRLQVFALLLGVAKGQRAGRAEMPQQRGHRVQTLGRRDLDKLLVNRDLRRRGLYADALWRAHELLRQRGDAFRVRCAEEQGLAFCRGLLDHGADVVQKTHVQHAVGLVQHQGVQPFQGERGPRQMVHHAARRAHHNVRAVFQRGALAAQRYAAAQGHHFDVVLRPRQTADFGAHLVGQFARGAQNQGLHRKPARIEPRQQSQCKGGGFAAAGLRLGNQVLSSQRRGQGGGLDRGHLQVTELLQVLQCFGG